MKLFSTLIQRIAVLAVVLVVSLGATAANYTFATIADLNAATNLVDGDKVTITNDVVVDYILDSYIVLRDKSGTATCLNYNYYIASIMKGRLEVDREEWPEIPPVLQPGDVFKKYTATVEFYDGFLQLKPALDSDWLIFEGFTEVNNNVVNHPTQVTKVTVGQLLNSPNNYIGKVVALDEASTRVVGFNVHLIQGADTLKNFRITGLDTEEYPNNLVIKKALCMSKYGGGCKLELSQEDYTLGAFTDIKALKATTITENIPLNLNVQVLRKETYNGKTYITIKNGSGKYLMNHSAVRVLLNTENAVDKTLKVGDYINLKTSTAKFRKYVKNGGYFTPSLLTLDAHETTFISAGEIEYLPIAPEEIAASMLDYYEFLPAVLNGYVELVGTPTAEQTQHNVAPATLTSMYGEAYQILLDLTYKPAQGSKFVVNGILDIPLWMDKSNKTLIVPVSEKGFMADSYEFDNIAAMVEFGAPISSVVNYKFKNPITITGIETIAAVGDEDMTQHVIFVADATGSLVLRGSTSCNVGDAITSVSGYYDEAVATSVVNGDFNFGVANRLELDSTGVELATSGAIVVEPIEVTIAQLLASDEYASKLVKLTDFTYASVEIVVQDETVTRHFIYQGTDSMAVDASFAWQKDKSSIVGNYYLNGYYTSVIPQVKEPAPVVVENVSNDDSLFVLNNTIYATGADIEVYDIMGRLIISGVDAITLENINQNILVVRTKYFGGQTFVTKVINR